MKGKTKVLN